MILFIFFSYIYISSSAKVPYWEPTASDNFILQNIGKFNGVAGEDVNIKGAWDQNYTGKNVKIAFLMSGCNPNNLYLQERFIDWHSFNFNMKTSQVDFTDIKSMDVGSGLVSHACSSKIKQSKQGAAPEAKFSVVIIEDPSKLTMEELIEQFSFEFTEDDIRVDYIPYTYKSLDTKERKYHYLNIYPEVDHHLNDAVQRGRNYKGTIYITNAPTMESESVLSSYISNRAEAIEVSASTNIGSASYIAYPSPSILVNVPVSGAMFNSTRSFYPYIRSASGWSSEFSNNRLSVKTQASTAAGIVSLMLEANPNLGWRDVQWILLHTASKNDPESIFWKRNAAGYDYHPLLGFGRINAELACNISREWEQIPRSRTVSGETNGIFHFTNALESPLYVDLNIDTEDDDLFFEFAYLTINMSSPDLNMMRVYVSSPSGTTFQVISPMVTQNRTPQALRVLLRCFFGEKVKGIWSICFCDSSYGTSQYLKYVKLEISGVPHMPKLPQITKKKAQSVEFKESTVQSIHISAPNFAECGSNITITVTYNNKRTLLSDMVPIMLVNLSTNRATLIGSCRIDGEPHQIYLPCLSLEREQKSCLMIELPEIEQRALFKIYLFNSKEKHEIASPEPYSTYITSTDVTIPFSVATQAYRLDSGLSESMFISLFDMDTHERVGTWRNQARWDMSISIPANTNHKNCLLIATPTYVISPYSCSAYIVPVHIVSSQTSLTNFIVSLNTNCSLDPDIITIDTPTPDVHPNSVKIFLDVFVMISPVLALLALFISLLIITWKIKTRRNPEDLESLYITS